jgi:uncharacterized tellurite resistance protein B-like protein
MLDALKKLFSTHTAPAPDAAEQVARSLAALLHEMTRVDMQVRAEDLEHARAALIDLLGVDGPRADALLAEAALPQNRLTSYFEPVSALNAAFSAEQKLQLVEHLWRVAHADASLDVHEDHLVRKIADLLYVPNVQSMLARQRVRERRG